MLSRQVRASRQVLLHPPAFPCNTWTWCSRQVSASRSAEIGTSSHEIEISRHGAFRKSWRTLHVSAKISGGSLRVHTYPHTTHLSPTRTGPLALRMPWGSCRC